MKRIISLLLSFSFLLESLPAFPAELPLLSDKDYFISAGDIINMTVMPAPEFSKEVTVQPDGTIEIPLIGSITAAGMRVSELEKLLTAKFSKYVSNPTVSINVRRFSAYRVAIIGQVQKTGYFEYNEGMKILDLIASAGGLADYARMEDVRIFRKTKSSDGKVKEESFKINLGEVMSGKLDKNLVLASGDIVYVPRKRFTTAGKWVTDNILPWSMLFTFGLTLGIVARRN